MADKRVRFQDVKPYDAPERLDELRGPAHGTVQLPPWVYWGPNPVADLDRRGDAIMAYQATLQEGRTVDQVQILNPDRLIELWPQLHMPPRVRELWEDRFLELRRPSFPAAPGTQQAVGHTPPTATPEGRAPEQKRDNGRNR